MKTSDQGIFFHYQSTAGCQGLNKQVLCSIKGHMIWMFAIANPLVYGSLLSEIKIDLCEIKRLSGIFSSPSFCLSL